MRNTFVNCLIERARIDKKIFLITPDLGFSVVEKFQNEFPDRFLNIGIAEQNAIGVAAGLALSGYNVYVYSIIPFITMRCFEQVRVDVAYMNTNVKLIGVGAGLNYGPAGATHHAIEDIAIMRVLPNMTVCCPGDKAETEALVNQSFELKGPMYLRLGVSPEQNVNNEKIRIGKASEIFEGKDVALICTSNMLEEVQEIYIKLKQRGIEATLVSMHTIKPLDEIIIEKYASKKIPIITFEEHNIIGGLGSAIAETILKKSCGTRLLSLGIKDVYSHYVGNQKYQRNLLIPEMYDMEYLVNFIIKT